MIVTSCLFLLPHHSIVHTIIQLRQIFFMFQQLLLIFSIIEVLIHDGIIQKKATLVGAQEEILATTTTTS